MFILISLQLTNVIIYSFQISHSARLKIIFNHILIKLRTQGNNNEVTSTKSSTRSQVNDPELFKHHKKTDLLHHYVIGWIAMAQKHQSVSKQ